MCCFDVRGRGGPLRRDSTGWPVFGRRDSASAPSWPFRAEPVSLDRRATIRHVLASIPLISFLQNRAYSSHVSSQCCFSDKTAFGLAAWVRVRPKQNNTRTVIAASAWAPPSTLRRPKIQVVNSPVTYFPCLSFAGLREVLRRRAARKAVHRCR